MITVRFIAAGQAPRAVECKPGQSLMQVAVKSHVDGIEAECGGMMTCGTCHVYVREPHASRLPAPGADEEAMLGFTASPRGPGSRLACQVQLTDAMDGITVDLPPTQY